jgi:16S rRNA (guanine527-N7)-methyltransferase
MNSLIAKYFTGLPPDQEEKFSLLPVLYKEWNDRINLVSRKDIEHLEERHILHSLAIARALAFRPGTRILDAGTGGGFPGIPLAILFPQVHFVLADSIGKKIAVVREIAGALSLGNVEAVQSRAESMHGSFDFVTGRAVAAIPDFLKLVRRRISGPSFNTLRNGILYLKGGDFEEELRGLGVEFTVLPISVWFAENYFETKKLIHIACA